MKYVVMLDQKKRIWVWIAIDRISGKILGFEIGDRSEITCDKLYKKLALYNVELFCTNALEAYK